ncbi:hypothetical protein L4D08_20690 [Photobacterium chitinilyticum]|uniref:hypothetical protein n=1 Tax=Photobacterium chitinilyticum TaxID=2485123 RepID=UPI003D1245E7
MLKKIIVSLLITFSFNAFAFNETHSKIAMIETRDIDVNDIYVSGTIHSQGWQVNDRVLIDVSKPGGKAMLSAALSALMANKQVTVRYEGCLGYAPKALAIIVKP